MENNEKKDVRKLIKDEVLNEVSGGGNDKKGTCIYCGLTYTNGWGKHMTDGSCPVYPNGL